MPSEPTDAQPTPPGPASPEPADAEGGGFDQGLLSPATVGFGHVVSDQAIVDALVSAEVALVLAYGEVVPQTTRDAVIEATGWTEATGGTDAKRCRGSGIHAHELAVAAVAGGNPVIPLVGMLRARVPEPARVWVHRGATSQDILDTALMLMARRAGGLVLDSLARTDELLAALAVERRDEAAVARTLTQHAVPTTVGRRAAGWLSGVRRAHVRLSAVAAQLPAQLGGAGGTLASFVAIVGTDRARRLPLDYAARLGLAAPAAPWHTTRWPVTEFGDALVQAIDAVGVIAADVATLSRTEIAEVSEGAGGGSSAMPQKRNPVESVLIRSAALRAPLLAATLHLAAASAADERPDGAWHAEWPTLRELARLALGATGHAASLVAGLRVDADAVARNLALTGGLILSERLSIVLEPIIGAARVAGIIAAVRRGDNLAETLRALPEAEGLDIDALLDPAGYTGLAADIVDAAVAGTSIADTMIAAAPIADTARPETARPDTARHDTAPADTGPTPGAS